MAFLAHAGFRMASVYGRQFHKALQHILHHFLPALEAKAVKNAGGGWHGGVWWLLPSSVCVCVPLLTAPALRAATTNTRVADLRAVGTRLHTYVSTRAFTSEPEGRSLKRVDESQYTRA